MNVSFTLVAAPGANVAGRPFRLITNSPASAPTIENELKETAADPVFLRVTYCARLAIFCVWLNTNRLASTARFGVPESNWRDSRVSICIGNIKMTQFLGFAIDS